MVAQVQTSKTSKLPLAPDLPMGVEWGNPVCVALLTDVDAAVRALPNRSVWMRWVLTEAARRELLGQDERVTNAQKN